MNHKPYDNFPPGLKTSAEIAEILAVQPRTILNWANDGRIPVALRMGNTIRFNLDDVLQALAEATREAQFNRLHLNPMKQIGEYTPITNHEPTNARTGGIDSLELPS